MLIATQVTNGDGLGVSLYPVLEIIVLVLACASIIVSAFEVFLIGECWNSDESVARRSQTCQSSFVREVVFCSELREAWLRIAVLQLGEHI